MRRSMAVLMAIIGALASGVGVAQAQGALVAGGLTALPTITESPNKLQNPGFETLSGGFPASWSTPSGWAADLIVRHSGNYSYRRGSGAGTSSQAVPLKKGVYNLSAWIKTEGISGTNAGIRLQLDLRPTISNWATTAIITGTRDWTLFEVKNFIVPQDMTVTVKLENFGGATGTAWFDDVKLVEQVPLALDVYMLYPNYRGMLFDDQSPTMRFDVSVTPPGGDFGRYQVRGTLKDEATGVAVATQNYAAEAHVVADLDGSLMSYARPYLASFSLIDRSSGAIAHSYPAFRVSKVAGSTRLSMNVSFDAKNRVLLRGKPRFILGVYDSGGGYSTSDSHWENQIWSPTGARGLDGLRINMYLNYWMGVAPADTMKALMTNLQKRGVFYLQTGNCFARWPAGNDFSIHNSDAYVRDIGAHSGSAGYYTADECDSSLMPGIFEQYKRLRSLDPDSATFAALFGHEDIRFWRDAADLLASDPYPMYAAEPAGGYNHRMVADWTVRTREAVKDARPFLTVLQFFKFTGLGRWPTRQEMRNHAYMSIVEGARGLWWWSAGNGAGALANVCSGWCAEKTAHLNDLKAVVGEIADLEPVLLADDAASALRSVSNPTAIKTKVKLAGGKGYVFTYNATNQNVTATFTWNTAPGAVTVNAEGRTVPASANAFTDTFGPYQAHVYVIGNGGSGGTPPPSPTGLTVSFTNPAAGATLSGTTTVSMSATGGVAPYTYRVVVGTTPVFTGTNNSFSFNTTTEPDGTHTLTATVTDSSSPARTGTATRTVTIANGTTPPPPGTLKVSVTAVSPGATVSGTVWPHVWVSGQSGTSNTFSVAIDGLTVASVTTSETHRVLDWDSRKVADGPHMLTATVRDATGKTGSTSLSVTTKNGTTTPPPTTMTASFTAPAAGATLTGTATVGMAVTGAATGANTFTLALDGRVVSTQTVSGTTASYAWSTTSATNGAHTLTLTVRDAAGKTATASRTVTVSNGTAPPPPGALKVSFTAIGAGATVSGTVWPHVWVSGQSGTSNTFTLMVDGRVIGAKTISDTHTVFPWATTGTTNGTHTITATVRDGTGKTGTASMTVTVKN